MLRRAFMRLLGLAPVAAVAAPLVAHASKPEMDYTMTILDGTVWTSTDFTITASASCVFSSEDTVYIQSVTGMEELGGKRYRIS